MSRSADRFILTGRGQGGTKLGKQISDDSTQPSQLLSDTPLPARPVKPHDWTYSTCHTGQIAGPSVCAPLRLILLALTIQKFVPSSTHEIPITFLARQDPVLDQILYYADVPLFEDELHDNGESILNARIVSLPTFSPSFLQPRVYVCLISLDDCRSPT